MTNCTHDHRTASIGCRVSRVVRADVKALAQQQGLSLAAWVKDAIWDKLVRDRRESRKVVAVTDVPPLAGRNVARGAKSR